MMRTPRFLLPLFLITAAGAAAPVTPDAAIQTDASQFLVPVAGNVRGAGGEHFRTDLTIVNFRGSEQAVRLEWIPAPGGTPVERTVTLPFLSYLTFSNVVVTLLETEGLGAILVTAVGPDGERDTEGTIDGYARIWTGSSCEGVPGTVSQSLTPMLTSGWRDGSPAYVHGVRQTSEYRTNWGVVNLDRERALTFRLVVHSAASRVERSVTVPPFTMHQEPIPPGPFGDLSVYVEPEGPFGPWAAYASSVNNRTGSGWVVPAVQPRTDVIFPTE